MSAYINKKLIEDGLMAGVITIKMEMGDLAAHIGDHWFWIGSMEEQEFNKLSFYERVSAIKDALDDLYRCSEIFGDEYNYYYYYLCENI